MKRLSCHYCCEQAFGTGRQVCSSCEALTYLDTMNHYETLGVAPDASPEDIKRAYRKKSAKHHPDRPSGSTEAQAKVNEAYECLSDPVRRLSYDQNGHDPAKGPSLDDIAEHALQTLIAKILEDEPFGDLVKLLDGHISESIEAIRRDKDQNTRRIAKLQKKLDRVVRKSAGKESLFNRVLKEQIRRAEAGIAEATRLLEVSERSLQILREHEDTKPTNPEIRVQSGFESVFDLQRRHGFGF